MEDLGFDDEAMGGAAVFSLSAPRSFARPKAAASSSSSSSALTALQEKNDATFHDIYGKMESLTTAVGENRQQVQDLSKKVDSNQVTTTDSLSRLEEMMTRLCQIQAPASGYGQARSDKGATAAPAPYSTPAM